MKRITISGFRDFTFVFPFSWTDENCIRFVNSTIEWKKTMIDIEEFGADLVLEEGGKQTWWIKGDNGTIEVELENIDFPLMF